MHQLFNRWRKSRRLAHVEEHLRMLEEQKVSAELGLVRYEGEARRLRAELLSLHSSQTLLEGKGVYDY